MLFPMTFSIYICLFVVKYKISIYLVQEQLNAEKSIKTVEVLTKALFAGDEHFTFRSNRKAYNTGKTIFPKKLFTFFFRISASDQKPW